MKEKKNLSISVNGECSFHAIVIIDLTICCAISRRTGVGLFLGVVVTADAGGEAAVPSITIEPFALVLFTEILQKKIKYTN